MLSLQEWVFVAFVVVVVGGGGVVVVVVDFGRKTINQERPIYTKESVHMLLQADSRVRNNKPISRIKSMSLISRIIRHQDFDISRICEMVSSCKR